MCAPSSDAGAGQCGVQVVGQCRGSRALRRRQCSHHNAGAVRQRRDAVTHQVAELTLHPIAVDCRTNCLAHDETDGRVSAGSWNPGVRQPGVQQHVSDEGRLYASGPTTNRVPKVLPAAHALTAREQQIRRTVWRDPCGDDPPGSRGRRGCACAGGSRASWRDVGCSAGRCACSRCCP
jgi:hypothetical protein